MIHAKNELEGSSKPYFRVLLENAIWLILERGVIILVSFYVGLWMARYLGPSRFGQLSFALAFSTILSFFSTLGMDSFVIRDLATCKDDAREILGTTFFLKIVVNIAVIFLGQFVIMFSHPKDPILQTVVGLTLFCFYFKSFDVVDFWFQSRLEAKYSVMARNIAFLIMSCWRISLILLQGTVIDFAWANTYESILTMIGFLILYWRSGQKTRDWRISLAWGRKILGESWLYIFCGFFTMIFMKSDQLIIGKMIGNQAVGIYSAAGKVIELPAIILVAITASLFPKFSEWYKNSPNFFLERYDEITRLYSFLGWLSFAVVFLFSGEIISLLFGKAFKESASILRIQAFSLLFIFNGGLRSSYLVIASKTKILFLSALFGAVFNIGLNFFLLPAYGFPIASYINVTTYALVYFLSNALFTDSKCIFVIQSKRFFSFYPNISRYWHQFIKERAK